MVSLHPTCWFSFTLCLTFSTRFIVLYLTFLYLFRPLNSSIVTHPSNNNNNTIYQCVSSIHYILFHSTSLHHFISFCFIDQPKHTHTYTQKNRQQKKNSYCWSISLY
ncbi:hypothetical protein J3Q64DRAFT_1258996 [Phycomyces blakesleeanus]|uniref:Uncharacterized protein n=1 Tax=Phycomyces blakesleeanus TaxID=4837 RepID=A0ABR3AP96_PHYBL